MMKVKNKKVLIYQMGKVASSSIKATLLSIDELEVLYTHRLSYTHAKYLNSLKQSLGWKVVSLNPEAVKHLSESLNTEPTLKIITLVREPISRNISAFFQVLDVMTGLKNAHTQLTIEELVDIYSRQYPHEIPLTWFDQDFKEALGLDIYNYSFPKDKGVLTIREGKYEVLIMQHDLDDSIKRESMENLLGIENIVMKKDNLSIDKSYAEVYQQFKQSIQLSDVYLKKMLSSNYACHFYSKEALRLVRKKWER